MVTRPILSLSLGCSAPLLPGLLDPFVGLGWVGNAGELGESHSWPVVADWCPDRFVWALPRSQCGGGDSDSGFSASTRRAPASRRVFLKQNSTQNDSALAVWRLT